MTINVYNCHRMRIAEEANGSFGGDLSGTMNVFLECPFREDSVSLELEQLMESPMHAQQHLDGYPLEVLLTRSAKLDFTINLETLTTKVTGTAVQGALGMLLKIAMGGENLGTGTTIASTSTASSFVTTSAAGIAVCSAVAITNSAGALEMREVLSKSGNTVVPKLNATGAPANGSNVHSVATYYMGGTSGDQTTSLQVAFEGLYANDRYLLVGGYLNSMSLELGPGGIPRVKFSWSFAHWYYAADAAANFAGTGALGLSTYTNNTSIVQKDSFLMQQTVGTATYAAATTLLHAGKIEFTPNIKYTLHRSPSGFTIRQALRDRSAPVLAGAFEFPHENTTWTAARDAQTAKAFTYQIGSVVASGGALIAAPTCQITKVNPVNIDGVIGQRVEWKARLDASQSAVTTDMARSAFRIHID